MEKRVYDNEKLEKILNRYIKEEKYGGFKPLLNEIFLRRAYEFGFDDGHMKKEIKNFVKRVERIDFGKNIPRMPKTMWATERYMLGKKGEYLKGWIYFNCDSYDLENNSFSSIDLYEFLTHEVYHKASENRKTTGLKEHNIGKGISLDEIITETAATRTTFSRSKTDNENFRQETIGYDLITFVVNLLATSFGIEERELLKGGLQNRKEFEKVCQKYISKGEYQNDFDILETNLDLLYNALYKEEENSNDLEIITANLKQICYQIFDMANIRIAKNTREINSEYADELAYDFQKNKIIIENNLQKLANRGAFTVNTMIQIIEEVYSSNEYMAFLNKVSDIVVLTNQKSQIVDQLTLKKMEKLAIEGELINHADEFGMETVKNLSREQWIQYHKKQNHEFDNPTEWDNDYVTKIMEQLWNEREVVDVAKLEEELDSKTKLEKIKDFIAQFKNRNLKKLRTSKENYKNLNNHLDERYKVFPENLKPLESGKNENNHAQNQERE